MASAASVDELMDRASRALVAMDYLACESLCIEAVVMVRERGDWPTYARILMPLQESRRMRRNIASEGAVRFGSTDLTGPIDAWLTDHRAASIVLTRPHRPSDAHALSFTARQNHLFAEVLWADNPPEAASWAIRSYIQPQLCITRPAPPRDWIGRWLSPSPLQGEGRGEGRASVVTAEQRKPGEGRPPHPHPNPLPTPGKRERGRSGPTPPTPSDWFLSAHEALGDAALAAIAHPVGSYDRVLALEAAVDAVPDHELLHQALGDALHAMGVAADRR